MIDIHSHLLYGIDDGSKNLDMSIDIAKIYVDNGITSVICTPHFIEGEVAIFVPELTERVEALQVELNRRGISLNIYPGHELFLSPDTVSLIQDKKVSTLNNSRYLLLEFPMRTFPVYTEDVIYQLRIAGYTPIIAHPERYQPINDNPNLLSEFIHLGALTQLNLPSLEGRYGKQVQKTATSLIKHGMIHFVASDAHSSGKRSPDVRVGLKYLSKIVSKQNFICLTSGNAKKVIRNEDINVPKPQIIKKSFIDRFF